MEGVLKSCIVCMLLLATLTRATMEDDEKDCADQLGNLASCMPYVSGSAPKPTPQCCEDTIKVKTAKPKCLCVLIKESTDPSLGLPINTTLAKQMPTLCKIDDAKVSNCPSILKLAPNSPDAKIFQVANADSSSATPSTATNSPTSPASTSTSPSSSSSDTKPTTAAAANGAASSYGGKVLGEGMLVVVAILLL